MNTTNGIAALHELANEVQEAQRQIDAARRSVEEDKRRRSASLLARIADFFTTTQPESVLDYWKAQHAASKEKGRNAAREWIIAAAGQRLAEQPSDVVRHQDQRRRIDHAVDRATRVNRWLGLAETANRDLWAAHRACKSASTTELLDMMTSSKAVAALSSVDTWSAADAVKRARQALANLVRSLPKQAEPADVPQPEDMMDLVVDLVFDPGFDVLSWFNMGQLDDSARKCEQAATRLQPLLRRLRTLSEDVEAKVSQEKKTLREIQAPYLEAAAAEVPEPLRVKIPDDCVLSTSTAEHVTSAGRAA